MRIAVSAAAPGTDSRAEERFGRCQCFVVFDDKSGTVETLRNDGVTAVEGAGIKSAGILVKNKVDVVLTGKVGPKAMHALQAGGIAVYTGVGGTVAQALEKHRNGTMRPLGVPNARPHTGKGAPELVTE